MNFTGKKYAARFRIEMSFSAEQIADMLGEYEQDRRTGMEVDAVAEEIYRYTSGYPYLVSAICKILDEDLPEERGFQDAGRTWSREGIAEAVEGDLIPCGGEWFANALLIAE